MIQKEEFNRLKRMLHCTRLSRNVFIEKEYSRRWQHLLSDAKAISLFDDRNDLPVADVVCNAEYPFTVRCDAYSYPFWHDRSHYPYCARGYVKTLLLPGEIRCCLNIKDDGKIHDIRIYAGNFHSQSPSLRDFSVKGWSNAQLIRLFTELPLAANHWKEEDDYINMEFDKIEKISRIRKVVAQLRK